MPTIHITTGLPASGKTTYAMELLRQSNGTMRRVNLDDIRSMLDRHGEGTVWSHRHEATAQLVQEAAVRAAVKDGFDVVIDNTHLTPHMPGRLKQVLAEFDDLTFMVHDFTDVPLAECLVRDAARDQPVGEEAIRRLHSRHVSATKGGWRLTPEWLADRVTVEPYEPVFGLPSAVMCDIDGTLALHDGRGPYDFDRCGEDKPNRSVRRALRAFVATGEQIVLLSGRSEEFRHLTEDWLARHRVPYSELWMRPAGDRRRDDVVKAELFDAHVRDRFHVRVSLDDRDRVVRLWRRMGLPTWQVNYGDF